MGDDDDEGDYDVEEEGIEEKREKSCTEEVDSAAWKREQEGVVMMLG
jgi:hypothetical protein